MRARVAIAIAVCLAACRGSSNGFAVDLTLDFSSSIDDVSLASIGSLVVSSTGDETYTRTISVEDLGRSLSRTERVVYQPRIGTTNLTITVAAYDRTSVLLARASTPSLTLTPGKTQGVELDLGAVTVDMTRPSYASVILADAPVAYYRLAETSGSVAHDSSPNGLDGRYGSAVTHTDGLVGEAGDGAASFAGGAWDASKIIQVPANTLLEPATAVTVECWTRSKADARTFTPFVSYGSDAQPFEPYVVQNDVGRLSSYVVSTGPSAGIEQGLPLTDGTLYHLALVYDGATEAQYINGIKTIEVAQTGALSNYDAVNGLAIGSSFTGLDDGHAVVNGAIDEVAIYPTALTSERLAAHYAAGAP